MTEPNEQPKVTEPAKRRAQELEVDLSKVQPTGKEGKRTVGDVERHYREEQRVMSEGEKGTERQATAEVGEPQRNAESEQEKSERLEIEQAEKIADTVLKRLIYRELDTRRVEEKKDQGMSRTEEMPLTEETSPNGSPVPKNFLEPVLTDDEKKVINQYYVLRKSLEIPAGLEKFPLSTPKKEDFTGTQEATDFAPRTPLPDWKPLPALNIKSAVTVVPTIIDFGLVFVGGQGSDPEFVELRNIGIEPVEITSVHLAGPLRSNFFIHDPDSATCKSGSRLEPGKVCTVGVRFKPTVERQLGAQLVFDTSHGQLEVLLIGQGGNEGPPPPP